MLFLLALYVNDLAAARTELMELFDLILRRHALRILAVKTDTSDALITFSTVQAKNFALSARHIARPFYPGLDAMQVLTGGRTRSGTDCPVERPENRADQGLFGRLGAN